MAGAEALYLVEDIKTELDHLVILLHSFLVELGFSPEDGGIHPPPGWRSSNGVYLIKYLLHPSKTPTCQLIVTKLGESVLKVHGVHLQDKTTYTLSSLKISNHIKTVDNKFQATNLQLLSRSFKNSVGLPLLQTCRSDLGLPITGLLSLPPEILLGILRFLPVQAIINISKTSKQLNDASKDQSIWKSLCKKDFPGKDSKDWREFYKFKSIENSLEGKSLQEVFDVLNLIKRYKMEKLQDAINELLSHYPITDDTVLEVAAEAIRQSGLFQEEAQLLIIRCAKFLMPKLTDAKTIFNYVEENEDRKEVVARFQSVLFFFLKIFCQFGCFGLLSITSKACSGQLQKLHHMTVRSDNFSLFKFLSITSKACSGQLQKLHQMTVRSDNFSLFK